MDGNLVLELKLKAESDLRSGMESLKPKEAAVLALPRSRLAIGEWFAKAADARRLIIPAVMLSRLLAVPRKTLAAVLDRLHRDLGAFPPDDLQFFVFKLVSCDEKLLKLLLNRL
jgi:hypothetical protein